MIVSVGHVTELVRVCERLLRANEKIHRSPKIESVSIESIFFPHNDGENCRSPFLVRLHTERGLGSSYKPFSVPATKETNFPPPHATFPTTDNQLLHILSESPFFCISKKIVGG